MIAYTPGHSYFEFAMRVAQAVPDKGRRGIVGDIAKRMADLDAELSLGTIEPDQQARRLAHITAQAAQLQAQERETLRQQFDAWSTRVGKTLILAALMGT